MLKAMSTYVYVKERLHPGLLDGLVRGGAQAIEIFAARQHLDYANRKQHVREIADWFQNSGVRLNSVHAPMFSDYEFGRTGAPPLNVASTDRAHRIEAMDEIKRALEVAEHIPFRFLVQHLGLGGEAFDSQKFEAAMTSVEHLRAFAKPLGVRILIENIPNELSTPDRLVEFIQTSHLDDVGVCFDVGHAHIMSNVSEAFETVKHHVRSTHVHDNAKDRDAHLWPGSGSIDWKQTMDLLKSAPHTPPLLLEIEGDEKMNPTEKMGEVFRKLEGNL
jgi:sugar phosphate isomerase/epimerase